MRTIKEILQSPMYTRAMFLMRKVIKLTLIG